MEIQIQFAKTKIKNQVAGMSFQILSSRGFRKFCRNSLGWGKVRVMDSKNLEISKKHDK